MSVRVAAGRHSRLTRDAGPTDELAASSHRFRQGTPHLGTPRQAHRLSASDRRAPAPFLVCLVVLAIALGEAVTIGSARDTGSSAAAAGWQSAVLTVIGASRIGGPPDLLAGADPDGDGPRRLVPSASPGAADPAAAANDAPPCTHDDVPALNSGYDDWATTIVDTSFALPASYHPPDLVPASAAGISGWALVRSFVIDDLRNLARAADQAGNPLAIQSGHRTRERQADVFAGWVASSGEAAALRFSARPGHSEHQLGTALDLRATAGGAPWSGEFGSTAAGRWLARHAPEYGFVLSYPAGAEADTCYGAEAWHVRYVGRAVAAQVEASGLPLRVWLWRHARSG